jgi:hypothetical protein
VILPGIKRLDEELKRAHMILAPPPQPSSPSLLPTPPQPSSYAAVVSKSVKQTSVGEGKRSQTMSSLSSATAAPSSSVMGDEPLLSGDWLEQRGQLIALGFDDDELNRWLLNNTKGDLPAVVDWLSDKFGFK